MRSYHDLDYIESVHKGQKLCDISSPTRALTEEMS